MKTTLLLPDDILNAARSYAQGIGVSMSELCVRALRVYLKKKQSANLVNQINAVCDRVDTSLDPAILAMQAWSLPKEDW